MSNKIIVPFDDQEGGTYELNIDLDRLSKGEVLNAIVGIGRTKEQSTFVSKINKAKKPEEIAPFPGREVRENKINYGKGFDYVYGTKPVSDQEDKNPFASALKKIKPSAETLSWLKSEVVEAKNVNELHKVIDKVLASGARINACDDEEWSFAAVVLKVYRKIDVAVNKYLKFVWAYLFTAMLLLYRSSFRAILLSKQSTVSY